MISATAHEARDSAASARAELRLAVAICGQGRHAEARPIVDKCEQEFDAHANKRALAGAFYWRCVCRWNLGYFTDALRSAERAVYLAQGSADGQVEFLAMRLVAFAQTSLPDQNASAVMSAERALALAKELAEPAFEHEALHTAAHVYNLAGRHEDALDLCQQGMSLARVLGVQNMEAEWLGVSGDAYYGLRRYREMARDQSPSA